MKYARGNRSPWFVLVPLVGTIALLLASHRCAEGQLGEPSVSSQAPDFPLIEATVSDIHAAMASGELDCVTLVAAYLDRIEEIDQSSRLNSIVIVNDHALTRARELDALYATTGELLPLHGIPILVKDNYDVVGFPTTAGSTSLSDNLPPDHSTQVQRLVDAGAIVIAKTNMAEFAFSPFETVSSIGGITRNPYDLDRTPAGSSGGTAAAVAANLGVVGLGTDTGNSIRGPSAHTCLVGIRSTIGLTSRDGIVPLYLRNDIGGPMCRTVEDAVRILDIIAGHDEKDPITLTAPDRPETYMDALDPDGLRGKRIGVLSTLSHRPNADREISALFAQAIDDIRQQGGVVIEGLTIDDLLTRQQDLWKNTFRHDLNEYLSNCPEAEWSTLAEIVRSGSFHPSIEARLSSSVRSPLLDDDASVYSSDPDADLDRRALRMIVIRLMDEHDLDVLIFPTWSNPPRAIGDLTSPDGNNSYQIPPHTGQPAMTVPMGFTRRGLPTGLQIVARPFHEATMIEVAYGYEQATQHRKPPEGFGALDSPESREGAVHK